MVKKHEADLDKLDFVDERTPPIPAPPISYYDFYKTNGLDKNAVTTWPEGPSMTRQEFAEECDINALMKRYEGHDIGSIMRAAGEPVYYDFAEAPQDLMSFMELMGEADKAFMTLPASVRKEFDNDPVRFVDFASDPANLDRMREWKLAPPAASAPAPEVASPVPPEAPKAG